jgi:ECF transporter S component (folate family)
MKSNATNPRRRTQQADVYKLVFAGLFVAVSAVLKLFELNFSQDLRFNFCSVPWIISGVMLGPIWGFAVGAVSDVVNYLLRPIDSFVIGFTLSTALTCAIPGIVFHSVKRRRTSPRYSLYTVILFVLLFIGVIVSMVTTGLMSFENGVLLLRGNPVSYVNVAILLTAVIAASALLARYYKKMDSEELIVKPDQILFATTAAEIICSVLINSILLYFMYGKGTIATFPLRLFKAIVSIPVFTTMIIPLVNTLAKRKFIKFWE